MPGRADSYGEFCRLAVAIALGANGRQRPPEKTNMRHLYDCLCRSFERIADQQSVHAQPQRSPTYQSSGSQACGVHGALARTSSATTPLRFADPSPASGRIEDLLPPSRWLGRAVDDNCTIGATRRGIVAKVRLRRAPAAQAYKGFSTAERDFWCLKIVWIARSRGDTITFGSQARYEPLLANAAGPTHTVNDLRPAPTREQFSHWSWSAQLRGHVEVGQ